MVTSIQDISTFTFTELLSFVQNHPVFSSRINEMNENRSEPSFMLALAEWDYENGDISIPAYFHPFFMKYYPMYIIGVDDRLESSVESHELPFLKAVIECELHYNGELPKSHTFWRIAFIENSSYTIDYEENFYDERWLRKEVANDNVFEIYY